jgi:hypothetical protein
VYNPTIQQLNVLGEMQGKGIDDYLPFRRTPEGFERVKEEEQEEVEEIGASELWELLDRLADEEDDVLTKIQEEVECLTDGEEDEDTEEANKRLRDIVDLLGGEEAVKSMRVEMEDVLSAKKWIPTVWVNMYLN